MEKQLYKCYTSTYQSKQYFWYVLDNSPHLYGNDLTIQQSVQDTKNLGRVADVSLYSINNKMITVLYKHKTYIHAQRNTNYDIEG